MPTACHSDYPELCAELSRSLQEQGSMGLASCQVVSRKQLIDQLEFQLKRYIGLSKSGVFAEYLHRVLDYKEMPISNNAIISAVVYVRRLCAVRAASLAYAWSIAEWKRVLAACFLIAHKFTDTIQKKARFFHHFRLDPSQLASDERNVLTTLNYKVTCCEAERQFHLGLLFVNSVEYFAYDAIKVNIDNRDLWVLQDSPIKAIRMCTDLRN
jgi:hypothetical protein